MAILTKRLLLGGLFFKKEGTQKVEEERGGGSKENWPRQQSMTKPASATVVCDFDSPYHNPPQLKMQAITCMASLRCGAGLGLINARAQRKVVKRL